MANEEHLCLLDRGVEGWNQWRKSEPEIIPDLRGADLSNRNFNEVNLTKVNLSGANLNNSNFSNADLSEANLSVVSFEKIYLEHDKLSDHLNDDYWWNNQESLYGSWILALENERREHLEDLKKAKLNSKNAKLLNTLPLKTTLVKTDLSGSNLRGVNFFGAELKEADLRFANLSEAQAIYADFEGAFLTGACIEDWNINSETNLNNVICDYVYLKEGRQERRPHDPDKNFAPGEFTKLFQKALETVDLIFSDGIDWQVFLASFKNLQVEYGSDRLSIQAIEKKSGGAFVIRVEVPPDADKAIIEESFRQKYKPRLEARDEQIAFYHKEIETKRQENTRLLGIIETMAEKESRTINAETYYEQSGNLGIGHMSGGEIKGNAKVAAEINEAEKQNLADAATEIQQLLEQLSETNPTTTYKEKTAVVGEVVDRIESNPTLKAKVINALKAGGTEAFKEAIDHPLVNILVATIEGWQDAE